MTEYITKDSGERATFESGMQRDTQAGKPRFDLMIPEGVPYEEQMITRFAKLLGRGAEKYDDRNWEKADSEAEMARMKSSAFRHFMQWLCGETDEDHAAGTIFNILAFETTSYKVNQEGGEGVDQGEGGNEVDFDWDARPVVDIPDEVLATDTRPISEIEKDYAHPDDKISNGAAMMPSETAKKLGMDPVVQNIQMHFNDGVDKVALGREIAEAYRANIEARAARRLKP